MGRAPTRQSKNVAAPPDPIAPPNDSLQGTCIHALGLQVVGYVFHDKPDPVTLARAGLKPARDYFFGDWYRRPHFGDLKRGQLGWYDSHRYSLALALAFDDQELADGLLGWPDHDVCFDEGAWAANRDDSAVCIEFCRCASGRVRDMSGVTKSASTARRKRAAAFLQAAEAMFAGDPEGLGTAMTALMEWHTEKFKRERKAGWGYPILSPDGSILWLLARRRGIDLTKEKLAERYRIFLIESPVGGLEACESEK